MLARFGVGDVHHRAGDAQPLPFEILDLEPLPLLVAVGMTPRDHPAARGMGVVPVFHVVLLGQPAGPGIADVVVAQEILDLLRCRLVDKIPAPDFGLVGAARMPHRDRARLARMQRDVGKDFAGAADDPPPLALAAAALFLAMREIFRDDRRVAVGGRGRLALRQYIDPGLMPALVKRHLQPARHLPFLHVAPPAARRPDADEVDRAVADVVIAVAAEILGREFPVARDQPFLDAAEDFDTACRRRPRFPRSGRDSARNRRDIR